MKVMVQVIIVNDKIADIFQQFIVPTNAADIAVEDHAVKIMVLQTGNEFPEGLRTSVIDNFCLKRNFLANCFPNRFGSFVLLPD